MKECSFKPSIIGYEYGSNKDIRSKSANGRRNYDVFYQDQLKVCRNVEMKRNFIED
jgi:hypothetical protein